MSRGNVFEMFKKFTNTVWPKVFTIIFLYTLWKTALQIKGLSRSVVMIWLCFAKVLSSILPFLFFLFDGIRLSVWSLLMRGDKSIICLQLSNFSLIWRRHHNRWRVQFLTCARHSQPFSSMGSLACHTYCDTGHPFIMVISEDPVAKRLAVGLTLPVLTTYM